MGGSRDTWTHTALRVLLLGYDFYQLQICICACSYVYMALLIGMM